MSLVSGSNQMTKLKLLAAIGGFVLLRSLQGYNRYRQLLTLQLPENIAVVTGCASGIGLEICLKLASNGWKVFGLDINEKGLAFLEEIAFVSNLKITAVKVDISDIISCDEAFRIISSDPEVSARGVDLLVNNAGIIYPSPLLDTPWEKVQQMYAVNVLGPIYLARLFITKLLRAPTGGHIVNISSMAGQTAWPWQGVYSCTKFSLEGFSDTLRREALAADLPLRVTAVCPGGVKTALSEGLLKIRQQWCEENKETSPFHAAAKRSLDNMESAQSLHDAFMMTASDVAECVCVAAASAATGGTVARRLEPATLPMQFLRWTLQYLPLTLADKLTTLL